MRHIGTKCHASDHKALVGATDTAIHFERSGASEVDIDHLVPLGDAWQKSAQGWDQAKREQLAKYPANLAAVSASANRSKGDSERGAATPTAAPPAAITWDWLHSTILKALRHIQPGARLSSRTVTETSAPFLIATETVAIRKAESARSNGLTVGPPAVTEVLASAERRHDSRVRLADVHLRAVSPNAGKIICVGLNYKAHIEESNRELPTYPVMFPKYASSLISPDADIMLPPESAQVDYEGELAVIIGKSGRRISEAAAADHVLGYTVCNDVTMRDYQYKTHQWMQGKAWDNSTPLGPYLVTPDEVDLTSAAISTTLNGEVVQKSDLSYLIFSIPALIATVSEFTEVQPGDVILTGTPYGVGYRRNPQLFLHVGDIVTVEIEGVGTITNKVSAEQI